MLGGRAFVSIKNATPLVSGAVSTCRANGKILQTLRTGSAGQEPKRYLSLTSCERMSAFDVAQVAKQGLAKKCSRIFEFFNPERYRHMALGCMLYENIVDDIDYTVFFEEFSMADTFYSWFLITELHVWMLMARYMAEGEYGKLVRNYMVEAMWRDIDQRVDLLGAMTRSVKKKEIIQLSNQFNAAIINYDEGILSDDKVLAGALWRVFFHMDGNNPEHLEQLLVYVRKQVCLLDQISLHEVKNNRSINWIGLKTLR